jgi:hypothetical protein
MLLTQHKAELGFGIGFFKFRLEDDHYTILQEVVELQWICVKAMRFSVMNPASNQFLVNDDS